MSQYVDGFVITMKKKNLKKYKKMATLGRKVWMKHGALSYYETVAENIDVPWGWTFKKAYKLKADETLIFAFIVYKSKAHRNQVNKKVHADPLMVPDGNENIFDWKRSSVGGFKVLVKA